VFGLILELDGDSANMYRKVGSFSNYWSKRIVVGGVQTCPEFPDVHDLCKLRREEITIV
jgi:hypothetical protein